MIQTEYIQLVDAAVIINDSNRVRIYNLIYDLFHLIGPWSINGNNKDITHIEVLWFTTFIMYYPSFERDFGDNNIISKHLKEVLTKYEIGLHTVSEWSSALTSKFRLDNSKLPENISLDDSNITAHLNKIRGEVWS